MIKVDAVLKQGKKQTHKIPSTLVLCLTGFDEQSAGMGEKEDEEGEGGEEEKEEEEFSTLSKAMRRCSVTDSDLSVHPSLKPRLVSVLTATSAERLDDGQECASSETDASGKKSLFTNTFRSHSSYFPH